MGLVVEQRRVALRSGGSRSTKGQFLAAGADVAHHERVDRRGPDAQVRHRDDHGVHLREVQFRATAMGMRPVQFVAMGQPVRREGDVGRADGVERVGAALVEVRRVSRGESGRPIDVK